MHAEILLSSVKTSTGLSDSNADDIGKNQWLLLAELEKKYLGQKVPYKKFNYDDEVWFQDSADDHNSRIYWEKNYLKTFDHPARVLIKSVFFEYLLLDRLESSTVKSKLNANKNGILGLISSKGLLAGEYGNQFLGLNHITDTDLLFLVDKLLLSSSSRQKFLHECHELVMFIKYTNHLAKTAPFYEISAPLPWVKTGIKLREWADQRALELDHEFRSEEGYSPIVSEIANPLIQKALNIVLDYGQYFSEFSPLVRDYEWGKEMKVRVANDLLLKYKPVFENLIPAPDITGLSSSKKVSLVFIWLRKLLALARGACLNIILFTTGLRNKDIRNLKCNSCKPSSRVDILYYIEAHIKKTKNVVMIPVPKQTYLAIELLRGVKFTKSEYLFDANLFAAATYLPSKNEDTARISPISINKMLRSFAQHFSIPFFSPINGEYYSAHNYRTTVAGWLDANSNLSILMIRRLFGHSNDVMPTIYLKNNPTFIQERKEQKERAAAETAHQMALAASEGKVAGAKGEQLINGYKAHVSRLEAEPNKSHSLTDLELVVSFEKLIEQRLLNESMCGFMTPFGIRCMRNPSDSSPAPCASRAHRDKTKEIDEILLNHINLMDPASCIGISCDQALLGPWSESLRKTLLWNIDFLKGIHGKDYTDDHFRAQAISFIRQYAEPLKKVFQIEVSVDGILN